MKMTIALFFTASLFTACSNGEGTNADIASGNNTEVNGSAPAPKSDKETEIELTFSSGIMKGTHLFKPEDSNAMSQINVGFSDKVSEANIDLTHGI